MPNTIPDTLRDAFAQKKLIPVVGAGVSMSLKDTKGARLFPGWWELLDRAAKRIEQEGDAKLAMVVSAMLGVGDYQQAADYARKGLGGRLWGQFFKEIFSVTRADIDDASLALPQAVWALGQRVVTLNYDRVLRFASPCPDDVIELDNTNKNELADFNRDALQHPAVWHLHGRIDNLEKIIFTSESYSKLYLEQESEYKAALEIFRALCRDMHLLFVGCSLEDAELLVQLARQHQLFATHVGPHFALVREANATEIAAKLVGLPVKLVTFADFGQPLLDTIAAIAYTSAPAGGTPAPALAAVPAAAPVTLASVVTPTPTTPVPAPPTPRAPRIAILRANPIGHGEEDADYIDLLAEFKKLKCQVSLHPLNLVTLNALADVDYVFILSRLIKNRLVIEDEFLDSRSLSLPEMEQNLGCTAVQGVCLFLSNLADTRSIPAATLAELSLPTLILPRQDKQQVASFCFQLFKKAERKWLESQPTVANLAAFHLTELKAKPEWQENRTALPTLIDPRSTRGYIGRASDLTMLCRELLQLASSNEVLVIKGSGGICKTATIKKIAVAMAARCLFGGGIDFIDCEFITDAATFANKAVASFNLENALDLPKQLRERFGKEDKLIILDNLETLLYLPQAERGAILSFIDLLADHASVVVTTREIPPLVAMREITLRPFTSEEGLDLFMQTLGQRKLVGADADAGASFIRVQIVERLLDNNPLAIKLVASNVPSGKSMHDLQQELEQDIFGKAIDAAYADFADFDQLASGNIERKKSLFASILFSYRHLGPDAQRTFELLSLFPDGISLHDLQQVGEQRRSQARKGKPASGALADWRISDAVIKQLEDKSITQIDNDVIKLQSIVGKFAEYQLSRRSPAEQAQQHHHALAFHIGFAQLLFGLRADNRSKAAQWFSHNRGNFFKSLASFELAGIAPEPLLGYLLCLSTLAGENSANATLAQAMACQAHYFAGPEHDTFALLLLFNQYYGGEFASALARLQAMLPVVPVAKWVPDTWQAKIMLACAVGIYGMEGETLLLVQLACKSQWADGRHYRGELLYLGHIAPALLAHCQSNFFTLEAHYQNGSLQAAQVTAYLAQIYEKDHIELMQTHYLQAKLAWQQTGGQGAQQAATVQAVISTAQINKLVSINPYTLGLQQIMLALTEPAASLQEQQFERGIDNLQHIKYYYVEALLLYATCLKQHGQIARCDEIHAKGLALARHHHYRRLQYQFDVLAGKTGPWREEDYPLPEGLELDGYINWLIKERQKRR
jgi:hypothetical protein